MNDVTLSGGTTIGGRYRIVRPIGSGGMGLVYEAESLELGQRCAVKLVRATTARDAHARLEREARALAKLSHPNVVQVFDWVDDAMYGPAVVMELLRGESLAQRLARKGAMAWPEVIGLFAQALDGLGAAHQAGMVHRDIKPSNLFLVPLAGGALVVKVLDFGIVRADAIEGERSALTGPTDWMGTPQYMAPEQVLRGRVDERADLYAVGCCIYEALAGQAPFVGDHAIAIAHNVLEAEVVPLPNASAWRFVQKSIARDCEARFSSAAEMRATLLTLTNGEAVGEPSKSPRSKRPMRVAALAALALVATAAWLWPREQEAPLEATPAHAATASTEAATPERTIAAPSETTISEPTHEAPDPTEVIARVPHEASSDARPTRPRVRHRVLAPSSSEPPGVPIESVVPQLGVDIVDPYAHP